MTRLTRAELVDLVRRLVESLGDGGLSRTLCIEAERALKAEYAALAERLDSATPVVEWETDAFGNDYVKQGNVLSMVAQTLDGNFGWETRTEGYADTEAEAKSAAIAAARSAR